MFIQNSATGLARRRRRYSKKGNPLPVYKNRAGLSVFLVTARKVLAAAWLETMEFTEAQRGSETRSVYFSTQRAPTRFVYV